ncbi:hypothetical protein ES708_11820 [subsurface metagenome]
MAGNCRTCKHHQRMTLTKLYGEKMSPALGCLTCADYPEIKSNYEPIKDIPEDKQANFTMALMDKK